MLDFQDKKACYFVFEKRLSEFMFFLTGCMFIATLVFVIGAIYSFEVF